MAIGGGGGGWKVLFAVLQNSREIASPITQTSAGLGGGFAMTVVLLWMPDGDEYTNSLLLHPALTL